MSLDKSGLSGSSVTDEDQLEGRDGGLLSDRQEKVKVAMVKRGKRQKRKKKKKVACKEDSEQKSGGLIRRRKEE